MKIVIVDIEKDLEYLMDKIYTRDIFNSDS